MHQTTVRARRANRARVVRRPASDRPSSASRASGDPRVGLPGATLPPATRAGHSGGPPRSRRRASSFGLAGHVRGNLLYDGPEIALHDVRAELVVLHFGDHIEAREILVPAVLDVWVL